MIVVLGGVATAVVAVAGRVVLSLPVGEVFEALLHPVRAIISVTRPVVREIGTYKDINIDSIVMLVLWSLTKSIQALHDE